MNARQIDVAKLVDRQTLGKFHFGLWLSLFLVVLLDGYDLLAGGFATPAIIRAWSIPPAEMRYFLSASLFGVMFGAISFGGMGDRYGRKTMMIVAAVFFGAATLGCAFAGDLYWLTILRFLAGIGIGGVMPNAISLAAEMAPKGAQATLITLMFIGTPVGGLLPGPVTAWLVPRYGWPVIFWIGGFLPLVISVLLAFFLPESILFLAQDERRRARTAAVARRIEPTLEIRAQDRFVVERTSSKRRGWCALFREPFTLMTPLLALLFVINFMVLYFMVSWMPQLLDQASASPTLGIWATTIFEVAGAVGGVVLSRFLDRGGLVSVAVLFTCAVPLIAVTGYAVRTPMYLMLTTFFSGLCVVGLQFGLNATAGILYPTAIRSNGIGFAFGVGRLGAVAGPLLGGTLIALGLPIGELYVLAALPMALGAVACYGLIRVVKRRKSTTVAQAAVSGL